jgi:hypothetical protein
MGVNFMEKTKSQKLWEKAEKQLKGLSAKAVKIAKGLQQEAIYGVKISRLKVEEMGLESKKAKFFQQIGTEAFKLFKEKKLKNNKISNLCAQVDKINTEIRKRKAASSSLKKKISQGIKKLK